MSNRGLRIIGVAGARFNTESLPTGQHDFVFNFIGFLGLADPVRPQIKDALKECYNAGIRTIMITGDYPGTAKSIARQICLRNPDQSITGPELDNMTDEELSEKIKTVNIFSRMVPEQKLRLVKVLKNLGEIVAMTGDGVNDAPALKSAHIGIAMGGRGTDVAREAASIVLLEDDFNSIVQAIKMGRRIFDNLKKAMMFIFSVHIPIAGLSLIPVLFKWPLALFPVHIVFLELIIDPACSIVFEAEAAEKNIMDRPPRPVNYRLFGIRSLTLGLVQGLIILGSVIGVYRWGFVAHGEQVARALAFITLVIANLGLILTNRSRYQSIIKTMQIKSPTSWWIIGGTLVFLSLVIFVPVLREIFRFDALHQIDLIICLAVAIVSTVMLEILKMRPIKYLFD